MSFAITIFEFAVLIFSAVLHEVAHGYTAQHLGDDTAEKAGRLTLNPIKHLDLFGSILMPILLYLASGGAFFFAAAKPVPYNPNNLRNPRSGGAKIALAGPATNFCVAIIFGAFSMLLPIAITTKQLVITALVVGGSLPSTSPLIGIYLMFLIIVYVNTLLGVFNLVPIPPLDGSRVLFAALPQTPVMFKAMYFLERWGMLLVLMFVFFGFSFILPIMSWLFALFTGQLFM